MRNFKKLTVVLVFISICFSCSKDNDIINPAGTTSNLETYLKNNCDYVHKINGFYIVGSSKSPNPQVTTPTNTTGKQIWEHAIRLFSNFLDQNGDGQIDSDRTELANRLAKKTIFIIGDLAFVDKISFATEVEAKGLYGMSMQTDSWDYLKSYNGKGWAIDKLSSSTWRPDSFNALWEETFHTVTEAYSRSDATFAFTPGKALRQFMEADIAAATYDISVQNAQENGQYDKVTAVNEYIHQIWAINFAGHSSKLNVHQKGALDFMIAKGVPMTLDASYNKMIGTKVKE